MGRSILPKYAEVDPDSPRAWSTCDRCGLIWNLYKLAFQYQYEGTAVPQNTGLLVCPRCMDSLQPQLTPQILPPDPPPIFNARVENYAIDEDNHLATEPTADGDQIVTGIDNDGASVITNEPVPEA